MFDIDYAEMSENDLNVFCCVMPSPKKHKPWLHVHALESNPSGMLQAVGKCVYNKNCSDKFGQYVHTDLRCKL